MEQKENLELKKRVLDKIHELHHRGFEVINDFGNPMSDNFQTSYSILKIVFTKGEESIFVTVDSVDLSGDNWFNADELYSTMKRWYKEEAVIKNDEIAKENQTTIDTYLTLKGGKENGNND